MTVAISGTGTNGPVASGTSAYTGTGAVLNQTGDITYYAHSGDRGGAH
jgi:hypothetical protein